METVALFILGMACLLPIGDCYTSRGKGGYPVGSDGRYYRCEWKRHDAFCRRVCAIYNAGYGYCYGVFKPSCYCEGLTRYGGYPVDFKGSYYPCLPLGKNKWCQEVCKRLDAGYGYCYGFKPYCYCEGL